MFYPSLVFPVTTNPNLHFGNKMIIFFRICSIKNIRLQNKYITIKQILSNKISSDAVLVIADIQLHACWKSLEQYFWIKMHDLMRNSFAEDYLTLKSNIACKYYIIMLKYKPNDCKSWVLILFRCSRTRLQKP